MIAPFAKVFEWADPVTSFWGLILGIGFGFFLEKAGFGSAKKIAGVWYGYDFAVIRVMFSAIITAMLGLFLLHYIGFINFSLVFVNHTFIWPQIIGGMLFGMGFNIGQYCPGTSVVACATGKLDGLVFVGGFIVGVLVFSFIYPAIFDLTIAGYKGRLLLSDAWGLPIGLVALIIVIIGLGVLFLTHVLDKKLGNE